MAKFDIIEIVEISCSMQSLYKLSKDEVCAFDDFEMHLEDSYKKDMKRIYTIMEKIGCGERLPDTMFRPLKGKKLKDAFEVKSGDLRVYGYHHKGTGKIIILCGFKKDQKDDLVTLSHRIQEFKDYIEQKN